MECNLVGKNHKMTTFYLRCKPKRRHFARPIFCFCLWWGYCQTWNKEWINTYFLKRTSRNTGAHWLKEYKNWSFNNVIFTLFVFQSIYGWRSRCLREHHNLHHKSRRQPEDTHKKYNSKKNCWWERSCMLRSRFDKWGNWGYPRKSSKKIEVAWN